MQIINACSRASNKMVRMVCARRLEMMKINFLEDKNLLVKGRRKLLVLFQLKEILLETITFHTVLWPNGQDK